MALKIELLGRQHRPLLKDFRNRHTSLTEYLQRYALRHSSKDLLARTWVAVGEDSGKQRIAGYFSLAAMSVARSTVIPGSALDRLPQFPIPGVLIARLAVDTRVQGQGIGRFLFEEALGRTLQLARSGPIAFRLLVTDAIDADAARFYEHFGFARLSAGYPGRMVLDLRPLLTAAR